MPRVSVLMTVYNPGDYFEPAIKSILCQSFADFDFIMVDDGSTDGAKEIARRYAEMDSRIRLIDLPRNIGRTAALNVGLGKSQSDYIAVLDADDLAAPDRLAVLVDLFDSRPDLVLAGSDVQCINGAGADLYKFSPPTEAGELRESFAYRNPILHSSAMFRRSAAIAAGGYPTDYVYAQDFALWLLLVPMGNVAVIPKTLASVREHQSETRLTSSSKLAGRRYIEMLALFKRSQKLAAHQEARKLARVNSSRLHYFYAVELMRSKEFIEALAQLTKCFLAAPVFCLERVAVRVGLLWKRVRAASW